jgi:hypothetical protein
MAQTAERSNRRTAATGPTTDDGKAVSRLNALRHGLTARQPVLPGEDPIELEALQGAVREDLEPRGAVQEALVERVSELIWRLKRAGRAEVGIYAWAMFCACADDARAEADGCVFSPMKQNMGLLPGDIIVGGESRDVALMTARMADSESRVVATAYGRAFADDANGADAFAKLSRYETTLERSLHRVLDELRRQKATTA